MGANCCNLNLFSVRIWSSLRMSAQLTNAYHLILFRICLFHIMPGNQGCGLYVSVATRALMLWLLRKGILIPSPGKQGIHLVSRLLKARYFPYLRKGSITE